MVLESENEDVCFGMLSALAGLFLCFEPRTINRNKWSRKHAKVVVRYVLCQPVGNTCDMFTETKTKVRL
jgi:hypothetical protein